MLFFSGVFFGGIIVYLFADMHYKKRLDKAFWLWVKEQGLKGTINQDSFNELSQEFDQLTKGKITIEKN